MSLSTDRYRALCLNADYRPLATHPLKTLDWMESVKGVFGNRYDVVEEYDYTLRCPGSARREAFEMRLPSVVALRAYQPQNRTAPFTRMSVYIRAGGVCQYCSKKISLSELTFDHVIPRSLGGSTCFRNVVAACTDCNTRKANKSLASSGLKLQGRIDVPTRAQMTDMGLVWMGKNPLIRSKLPGMWLPYLGLEASGDEEVSHATPGDMMSNVFPADLTASEYWSVELEN